jgi:hypothetical protein
MRVSASRTGIDVFLCVATYSLLSRFLQQGRQLDMSRTGIQLSQRLVLQWLSLSPIGRSQEQTKPHHGRQP